MSPQGPKGGGRGVQKMVIWDDFQGLSGVTGGGRGSKNTKIGVTSFMNGPLSKPHSKFPNELMHCAFLDVFLRQTFCHSCCMGKHDPIKDEF